MTVRAAMDMGKSRTISNEKLVVSLFIYATVRGAEMDFGQSRTINSKLHACANFVRRCSFS